MAVAPAILSAQAPPLACDGHMATVRISEIPATGTKEGFLAAVAAHKAWYASHGSKDELFASPLVVRDEKTRERSYSSTQFMTFHILMGGPQIKQDEGYEAFVKLYRANSVIKSEYNICMPNPPAK